VAVAEAARWRLAAQYTRIAPRWAPSGTAWAAAHSRGEAGSGAGSDRPGQDTLRQGVPCAAPLVV